MIEVDRSGVLGQEGKLDVVRRGNGSAQGVLVDIPDLKVLEETPRPPLFRPHRGTPLVGVQSFDSPSSISSKPPFFFRLVVFKLSHGPP